eukprot:jgi/Botrbrau1/750/Bobra.0181s0009.1
MQRSRPRLPRVPRTFFSFILIPNISPHIVTFHPNIKKAPDQTPHPQHRPLPPTSRNPTTVYPPQSPPPALQNPPSTPTSRNSSVQGCLISACVTKDEKSNPMLAGLIGHRHDCKTLALDLQAAPPTLLFRAAAPRGFSVAILGKCDLEVHEAD